MQLEIGEWQGVEQRGFVQDQIFCLAWEADDEMSADFEACFCALTDCLTGLLRAMPTVDASERIIVEAFNADFDGDQMAVHLPLSVEAQSECRFLLLSPNNLLKPSDGGPVAVPSQDMVLGIYYLTQERGLSVDDKYAEPGEGKFFKSLNEAILAYENKVIGLHAPIKIRVTKTLADGRDVTGIVDSTLGRFLFNEILPQDLGFQERKTDEDMLKLEVNFLVKKKELKKILEKVINTHGATKTAEVLDLVKAIGYKYSTRAAMTVSISDMTVPPKKPELLDDAQKMVDRIAVNYRRGLITEEERYQGVVNVWNNIDKQLTKELMAGLDAYNNIFMMADSGARGSEQQIKQLAGMRGLMADTSGRTIELPIKSNFREGLDVLEYFMSAHGARKGLSDTALRTADSGYLTRRMVDVCQELIIRERDCCKNRSEVSGMYVSELVDGKDKVESLENRIKGRYSVNEIKDKDGNVIVGANKIITPSRAAKIVSEGVVVSSVTDSSVDSDQLRKFAFNKSKILHDIISNFFTQRFVINFLRNF